MKKEPNTNTNYIYKLKPKKKGTKNMENNNIRVGLHHVALKTSDIEKSLAMYKALGMKEQWRSGEGKSEIVMVDIGDGTRIEFFANGGDEFSPKGTWEHLALATDNVDEAYKAAIDAGFASISAPYFVLVDSRPYKNNIKIAFVKGPDGEVVEFFQEL